MIKRINCGPRMSGAVISGGNVYLAGQVPNDGTSTIEEQTKQVLAKIDSLLEQAGTSRDKLITMNVYLSSILDFDAMNSVYDAWVVPGHAPARTTVEARIAAPDLRVEMTAVAAL